MPIPPQNFGGVLVDPGRAARPVGDPRLWANVVNTPIDDDVALGNTPGIRYGNQIVMAQAVDRYSRSWSLTGVVFAPDAAWNGAGAATPPGFPDPAGSGAVPLEVWLSITQGIGQVTVEHLLLLMSGGTGFGHAYGLCNQQSSYNNGPYGATFTSPLAEAGHQGRAFAAIGSLIGNSITARAVYVRGVGGLIPSASVALLLTPYAPGDGI